MKPEDPINTVFLQGEPQTNHLRGQVPPVLLIVVIIGISVFLFQKTIQSRSKPTVENQLNPNQREITLAASQAIDLQTRTVKLDRPRGEVHANGVVRFSPNSIINVSPRLVGKVAAVYVKIGDHVKSGQPIAVMVSTDAANAIDTEMDTGEQLKLASIQFETAKNQLRMGTPEVRSAEANVVQAREAVDFAKRMLTLAKEQDSIGGFSDKPYTDAKAALRQSETQLSQDLRDQALDKRQCERTKKLLEYGVASRSDLETSEDVLGKINDAVENDREQLRIAKATFSREEAAHRSHLYSNQAIRQAETSYQQAVIQERAAFTALRMAKAALLHDYKQAEHDLSVAKADAHAASTAVSIYDHPNRDGVIVIRSPISGVVTARNVNPGQLVDQTGQTPWQMFTIVDCDKVVLDAQVFELDVSAIRIGNAVIATSEALIGHKPIGGRISTIAPSIDASTHGISVRAELDNRDGSLRDGMYLSAEIVVSGTAKNLRFPIVPMSAIVHDGDFDYVFVQAPNHSFKRQKVVLGEQRGEGDVLVTSGLKEGMTIVTHGALYLGTGATNAD